MTDFLRKSGHTGTPSRIIPTSCKKIATAILVVSGSGSSCVEVIQRAFEARYEVRETSGRRAYIGGKG